MPRRPRSALRSLPLLLGALLAAAPASAQEEVWTGSGETKSWNDAGNWASGRVPAPTVGLRLLFGAPEGAAFGFGGKAPLRFGQIHLATNSGPVVLQAPGIVLGGSVNGEPDVGFVLEDLSTPAVLRNEAPASLSLRGGVSLGWDLAIDAAGGPVRVSGGLDPAGHAVSKKGAFPLEISGGGPVAFRSFTLSDGGLSLENGADVALPIGEFGARGLPRLPDAPAIRLRGGSTLRLTNKVGRLWFRQPLEIGDPAAKSDRSTLVGNGERITFNRAPVLAPGACISNVQAICLGFHPTSAIPRTVRVPEGARIHCNGLWLGGDPSLNSQLDRTGQAGIRLLVDGPALPPGPPGSRKPKGEPVLLDLGDGDLLVGGVFGGCSSNALARLSGAAVLRTRGRIMVPDLPWRSDGNRLSLEGGARAECGVLEVGGGSSSNRLVLSDATMSVGQQGVYLGFGSERSSPSAGNRILLKDGSRLLSEGTLRIGRGRRGNGQGPDFSADNSLQVLGGSRLSTVGAEIGVGTFSGPVRNTLVEVDGNGSTWLLGGKSLTVGLADGAPVSNALVRLGPGTLVTNVGDVVVGYGRGSAARDCRLLVRGARVFSSGTVFVGRTGEGGRDSSASGGSIVLAGRDKVPGLWDFGGGNLRIGWSEGWTRALRRNAFELRPGGRAQNIGTLSVGGGTREKAFTEEAVLSLAGGSLPPVGELVLGEGGVLQMTVDPRLGKSATTPVAVLGNVRAEKGAFVRPVPAKGLPPRLYPLLAWKGEAKGIERLALAPDADASRWKLHVDAEKKRVFLQLLK